MMKKSKHADGEIGKESASNVVVDLFAILAAKKAETQTTRDIISDVQLKITDLNVLITSGREEVLGYAELEALRASRGVYISLRDHLKEKLALITDELKVIGENAQSRFAT